MSIGYPESTAYCSLEAWISAFISQTLEPRSLTPHFFSLTFCLSNCMDLHDQNPLRDYEEERTVVGCRTCCGIRSHMRSSLEGCQGSLGDRDFDRRFHGARDRCEIRARGYGRGRGPFFGVGPGVELPTRMHYFEGALNHENSAYATPGRGLRRIPVVNFDLLRTSNTLDNGYPAEMCTSELEQHLFDTPRRPCIGRTAHQFPYYDEYIADRGSEAMPGEAAVCPYGSVDSEQLAIRLQPGTSIDQSLHRAQTNLLNKSSNNETLAVDSASTQRDGPALLKHGLNDTAEEVPHGQDTTFDYTIQADDGETEASQDDIGSVGSSSPDEPIIFTPGSSI